MLILFIATLIAFAAECVCMLQVWRLIRSNGPGVQMAKAAVNWTITAVLTLSVYLIFVIVVMW